MPLFGWFSRAAHHAADASASDNSRGSRPIEMAGTAHQPRSERSVRREQLYVIVREVMVRVGILSAGYKFKVLALDSTGQRFVVMVDLAPAYAADPGQQRNIESLIAELAKARLNASVHAVYWRINGQIHAMPTPPVVAEAQIMETRLAPVQSGRRAFEPIDSLEMDAFKQAVAATGPISAVPRHRSPLLGPGSGHEEGEEFSVSGLGSLGATQYGELR